MPEFAIVYSPRARNDPRVVFTTENRLLAEKILEWFKRHLDGSIALICDEPEFHGDSPADKKE